MKATAEYTLGCNRAVKQITAKIIDRADFNGTMAIMVAAVMKKHNTTANLVNVQYIKYA